MANIMNYVKYDFYRFRHHIRYKKHVETNGLTCQECGGHGGYTESVLDYGEGPFFECCFCEGTGLVTRWMRGQWLRWKRLKII